jgi:hypothetical protein
MDSAGFFISERKVECNDVTTADGIEGTDCMCECLEPGYYLDRYTNECRQCSPGCMDCKSNCSCNFCLAGWDYTADHKCACTKEDYEVD